MKPIIIPSKGDQIIFTEPVIFLDLPWPQPEGSMIQIAEGSIFFLARDIQAEKGIYKISLSLTKEHKQLWLQLPRTLRSLWLPYHVLSGKIALVESKDTIPDIIHSSPSTRRFERLR